VQGHFMPVEQTSVVSGQFQSQSTRANPIS
jgi:hypothetical protein